MKIITVKNLVKKFGSFTANDNLTFDVHMGEIFGFLGANGAGKTTTMRILCGLSAPTSGKVKIAGFDVTREPEKVKNRIGYMSQKFSLYEDLTIAENIQLYAGIYGIPPKTRKEKMAVLLKKLELESAKDKLISGLPLGWKQKLAFSIAVLHDPAIVFLDEPTGGVDPVTRRKFWDLIYEAAHNGITAFVTTHYMDEAEYCDRVSIMDAGRIEALDSPANLKEKYHAGNMDEVFIQIARKQEPIKQQPKNALAEKTRRN
jgi:ABC-2 type transport system ATP-binding protein